MSAVAIDAPLLGVSAWARSGLMALTGEADGSPLAPHCDVMAGIVALVGEIEARSLAIGLPVSVDLRVLTERAAIMGLQRRGRVSCNGSCRMIEARDGFVALNLPRACDLQSVPALIGEAVSGDPWDAVARAARSVRVADLVSHGRLLGLAIAAVGERAPEAPYRVHKLADGRPRDWRRARPLVLDLTALWAGPLCGGILADSGARVVKVENTARPDTVRAAAPDFFDLLNGAKESVALDFTRERETLSRLIARADLVITNARPRALRQLGSDPEEMIAANPGLSWVAITAHGLDKDFIGFGDDCAAAAGLVAVDTMFAGDAIADPIAGLAAAAGAFAALEIGGGVLVDVSLSGAAAFLAGHALPVEALREVAARPRARPLRARAPELGAHTHALLKEML